MDEVENRLNGYATQVHVASEQLKAGDVEGAAQIAERLVVAVGDTCSVCEELVGGWAEKVLVVKECTLRRGPGGCDQEVQGALDAGQALEETFGPEKPEGGAG